MKFLAKKAWGRVSAAVLLAAVMVMAFASTASAAVDVDKLTEPITDEVTATTPKLLLFIGGIVAITFVIGWVLMMLRKGKRG